MRVREFFDFIHERHCIWQRKQQGLSKPWTNDPIMQKYKFCNVYRELDRVTIAISNLWRTPHAEDTHLWFAMAVARLVNWPATLEKIGYPVPWNKYKFIPTIYKLQREGVKVFGGAYIVSTNGHPQPKAEYLAEEVLSPLWKRREALAPRAGDTLESFHKRLMTVDGLGSFLAAQVVADMKYVGPLRDAEDWSTWAASGPGSRRGLNRVCGFGDYGAPWKESEWRARLAELGAMVEPLVRAADMPPIHAQDLQNCLCEFDKYERTRLGQGRPKASYPGLK